MILYIANIRIPTEKAHGLQIAKTCEALAKAGALEALWVSDRHSSITSTPETYYGLRHSFPIRKLRSIDLVKWGSLGFFIQSLSFALSAAWHLSPRTGRIVYGRDEFVLWVLSWFRHMPTVWETHTGSWNYFARSIAARVTHVVVISQGLKDFYVGKGVPSEKIVVAPDAIDLEDFNQSETKEVSRKRLGLPQDKSVALYIGRLDGWKGAETFCAASELLPDTVACAVIGGEEQQIFAYRIRYPRVTFLGFYPYRELPDNQVSADVLVLPNTGTDTVSSHFTSPLKLFTYMASGVPIVASDLPSIREVLDDHSAYFVPADDPAALAAGITGALADPARLEKAGRARDRVALYTWESRARTLRDTMLLPTHENP